MSGSRSDPTNTTSTTTELTTKNLNVSGNTGTTVVGGENGSLGLTYSPSSYTTNFSTDEGAVTAGTGLASHALDVNAAVTHNAINAVTTQAAGDISSITGLATQFGTTLADYQLAEQSQLGNVVSALNATYTANNTSANQQVINATVAAGQQASDEITKVAKYATIAVIGGIALYFMLRKQ